MVHPLSTWNGRNALQLKTVETVCGSTARGDEMEHFTASAAIIVINCLY